MTTVDAYEVLDCEEVMLDGKSGGRRPKASFGIEESAGILAFLVAEEVDFGAPNVSTELQAASCACPTVARRLPRLTKVRREQVQPP